LQLREVDREVSFLKTLMTFCRHFLAVLLMLMGRGAGE
jgi:hypothetical protein